MVIRVPSTSLGPEPTTEQSAQRIVPVQMLGNPAAAMNRPGQQLSQLAAEKYQEDRDREIQMRVIEIDNARRKADDEIVNGYLQAQGKNAVDGREAAMKAIAGNSKRSRAGVKDRAVLDVWEKQDLALTGAAIDQIDQHYRRQQTRWQSDTLEARRDLLVSTVGRVAFGTGYDPASGSLSREAERTRSAYLDSISELGSVSGWSKEQIELAKREADTNAFSGVAAGLINDERFDEASAVLSRYGDHIDEAQRKQLQAKAREGKDRFDRLTRAEARETAAWTLANQLAGSGTSLTEQRAAIDQLVQTGKIDGETAAKAWSFARGFDEEKYQDNQRAKATMTQALEQEFAKDPTLEVETLPEETLQKVDGLAMRGDAQRIHRTIRQNRLANLLADDENASLRLSRDMRTNKDGEDMIGILESKLLEMKPEQLATQAGKERKARIERRITEIQQLLDALATRPRILSTADEMAPSPPPDPKAQAPDMKKLTEDLKRALYPGSGR